MFKFLLAILILGLTIVQARADTYEGGSFKVSWLRFGQGGVFVTLSPAPSGCNGGTQYGSHFKLYSADEKYYKDMVSGLLAAYTADIKLSGLWFRNEGTCSHSHVLELYMFKYKSK